MPPRRWAAGGAIYHHRPAARPGAAGGPDPPASSCLAQQLRTLLPPPDGQTQFLVVGLGNAAMTPDAVGPLAVDSLLVTRHMVRSMPAQFGQFTPVSALCTGVLAQTGLETLELVQAAAQR